MAFSPARRAPRCVWPERFKKAGAINVKTTTGKKGRYSIGFLELSGGTRHATAISKPATFCPKSLGWSAI